MSTKEILLKPEDSMFLFVDFQAGLGFGVESAPREVLLNNAVALAKTATSFNVPIVSTTASCLRANGLPHRVKDRVLQPLA